MWKWVLGIHWGSFFVGTVAGAALINAAAAELGKSVGHSLEAWVKKQRSRFLSSDQKKLLWLTRIGGGKLVVNTRNPGTPVIFSPQRGYPFSLRHKIHPLLNWGLLEIERSSVPNEITYRLTEAGADRAEQMPDFESEFPVTGKFPDMEIY